MNPANLSPLNSPKSQTTKGKIKLLVFTINNLYTGIHIDSVEKIINCSTIYSSGMNDYGIITLDNQEITVIDLHKRLFNQPQIFSQDEKKYLLLAHNSISETFGIIIKQTPSLFDIDLSNVRVLPESYRRADTLKIASHVTIIKQKESEKDQTIFILDPDELIPPN